VLAMVPFERARVVSYRPTLSIVTIALSLTIRLNLPSNVCDARSIQQLGWGGSLLGQNFRVFPVE